MKKLLLLLAAIVVIGNVFAQRRDSIFTPRGAWVQAYDVYYEATADELATTEFLSLQWLAYYNSNAVRTDAATEFYNGHGYALNMADGGKKRWVNRLAYLMYPNITLYWSGDIPTYQRTTIEYATKAYYPADDHTANVISPTLFESKWGGGPRYQHTVADCPYDTTGIQYYCMPVAGNSELCTTGSYSTLNIPGATYAWTGDKVAVNGNGSTATATMVNEGEGWIRAQVSSPLSGTTIYSQKKKINLRVYGSFTGTTSVAYLQTGTWVGNATCGVPPYTYQWYLRKKNSLVQPYVIATGSVLTLQSVVARAAAFGSLPTTVLPNNNRTIPNTSTAFLLSLRVFDANGNSFYTPEMQVNAVGNVNLVQAITPESMLLGGATPSADKFFNIYPNPATSDINVSINAEETRLLENNYQVTILDKNMKKVKQLNSAVKQFNINVSDLNPDIYFIQIVNKDKQSVEQFIVQ